MPVLATLNGLHALIPLNLVPAFLANKSPTSQQKHSNFTSLSFCTNLAHYFWYTNNDLYPCSFCCYQKKAKQVIYSHHKRPVLRLAEHVQCALSGLGQIQLYTYQTNALSDNIHLAFNSVQKVVELQDLLFFKVGHFILWCVCKRRQSKSHWGYFMTSKQRVSNVRLFLPLTICSLRLETRIRKCTQHSACTTVNKCKQSPKQSK